MPIPMGAEMGKCEHGSMIREVSFEGDECPECVAVGDEWVHLRVCMTCGQIGCCDSSKNKHSHRHADSAGHPIARSIEPGESWMWCYLDEVFLTP